MKVRLRDEAAGREDVRGWLRVGKPYTVLGLEVSADGNLKYRIESESGTPALFEAELFAVDDAMVPSGWTLSFHRAGGFTQEPRPWTVPGFWEKYYDREPEAVAIYELEKQKLG